MIAESLVGDQNTLFGANQCRHSFVIVGIESLMALSPMLVATECSLKLTTTNWKIQLTVGRLSCSALNATMSCTAKHVTVFLSGGVEEKTTRCLWVSENSPAPSKTATFLSAAFQIRMCQLKFALRTQRMRLNISYLPGHQAKDVSDAFGNRCSAVCMI
jgi:hypothetical protein